MWGCFLNFSFDSLLLVFRNETDLCILVLHPATLLDSCINFNSFSVESLGFSIYNIMPPTVTVVLLPFQFNALISLFLPYCYGYDVP